MEYIFDLTLKVRDYECDLQGIVNNANYQHYTEHTRHEFLRSEGISFADLHNRGIDAVVARLQMAFKTPLRSGDEFVSRRAAVTSSSPAWPSARKASSLSLSRTSSACPT